MTIAFDSSAKATFSTTTSGSASLTTVNPNTIIVAAVYNETLSGHGSGVVNTVSSIASTNLPSGSWSKRNGISVSSFGAHTTFCDLEIWWAYSSAILSAENITATISGAADDAILILSAFYVSSGAAFSSASPWDTNASLGGAGATTSSVGSATPTIGGISTTSSAGMLLGFFGSDVNVTQTAGSGYTIITELNSGGNQFASGATQYQTTAAASGISVAFGSAATEWLMIVDALATPSGGGSPTDDIAPRSGAMQAITLMRERASGLLEPVRELWRPKRPRLLVPGFTLL